MMASKGKDYSSEANSENSLDKLEESDLISSLVFSSATTQIEDVFNALKGEARKFQEERKIFKEVSRKLDDVHFPSIIKLDVGGQVFKTSLETLQIDPDSMLALMFSGRFDLQKDGDGAYFIDRDGTHFRHILNFLRTGKLLSKDIKHIRDELLEEARFYQIQNLISILGYDTDLKESLIINEKKQLEAFDEWLPNDKRKWKLIYSGSRDGWEANDFHRCCDSFPETLILIKSEHDRIFGGYAACPWSGNTVRNSNDHFVFSVKTVEGTDQKKKFNAVTTYGSIYCNPTHGPHFYHSQSGQHDIYICNKPNEVKGCQSALGNAFPIPQGYKADSTTFLAGSSPFLVKELEVFAMEKNSIFN